MGHCAFYQINKGNVQIFRCFRKGVISLKVWKMIKQYELMLFMTFLILTIHYISKLRGKYSNIKL